MNTRFAIIDPAAGISGDMLLGALVSAGASADWLRGLPGRLGCPEVTIGIEEVDRCGVRAQRVLVRLPGGVVEGPGEAHAAELADGEAHGHHGHAHGHAHHRGHDHAHDAESRAGHAHHTHRHVGDLIAMIEKAPLSPWVRERAVRAFELLGEAEGRIHGKPAREVVLHEVGALDALVDIVGGIEGFEQLGISRIHAWPAVLGEGWVRAAHGVIPVPAPATGILVEGLEIRANGPVTGEATTPTGAVLLRVLADGPPPSRWRAVEGAAWGAGGRNPGAYPNALRLLIAEAVPEAGEVVALTTDVDDLSPEYVEALREALFAAGALDVQTWTTHGKKGRASFRIEALAAPGEAPAVEEALFRQSTTIGLRRTVLERRTLPRRTVEVRTEDGSAVRVKLRELGQGISAKPEYDDIIEVARRTGRPAHELARELQDRAVRSAAKEAGAPRVNPNRSPEE